MFERFDDAARRVIVLADAEARGLNHHSIDTGHLLLGLLRESDGAAARALTGLGIGYDAVLARVAESVRSKCRARTGAHAVHRRHQAVPAELL